jgi:hypothetical protein
MAALEERLRLKQEDTNWVTHLLQNEPGKFTLPETVFSSALVQFGRDADALWKFTPENQQVTNCKWGSGQSQKETLDAKTFPGGHQWSVCTGCRLGVICKDAQSKSAFVREAAHSKEGERPATRAVHFADGCNVCWGCQSVGGMDLWDGAVVWYRPGSDYTKVTIRPGPKLAKKIGQLLDSSGRLPYATADPLADQASYQTRAKKDLMKGTLPIAFLAHVYLQSAKAMDNSAELPHSIQCCKVDCSNMLKWNEMMGCGFNHGWIAARKTGASAVSLYVGDMEGPCCLLCSLKKNKSGAEGSVDQGLGPG